MNVIRSCLSWLQSQGRCIFGRFDWWRLASGAVDRDSFFFFPDCVISLDPKIYVRDDCYWKTIGENTISHILRLVSQIAQEKKNVFFQLNV